MTMSVVGALATPFVDNQDMQSLLSIYRTTLRHGRCPKLRYTTGVWSWSGVSGEDVHLARTMADFRYTNVVPRPPLGLDS